MNPVYHYPHELLNLLVDAIPLLFRGKKDVLTFFYGAGVSNATLADLQEKVDAPEKSRHSPELALERKRQFSDNASYKPRRARLLLL